MSLSVSNGLLATLYGGVSFRVQGYRVSLRFKLNPRHGRAVVGGVLKIPSVHCYFTSVGVDTGI